MNILKKSIAFLIALVMVFCLAACHPKGEVAISAGDIEITSAMYSYYLVMADMEAQDIINNNEEIDTTAKDFDYHKQTIEDKSYDDYVKDLALEHCLKAIAYQKLCAENELELSTEDIANADYAAQYNWYYYGYNYGYQYGYGDFLPLNGVGYNTYADAMKVNYYGDTYFKHLYDKGGEKEIAADDIQKAMDENYIAVYALSETYTDETSSDIKAKFTKYIDRIKNGEEFKTVYDEHNKTEDSSSTSSTTSSTESTTSSTDSSSAESTSSEVSTSSDAASETASTSSGTTSSEEKEEEPKAKDELNVIIGSEETDSNYKFSKFDEVKAMNLDEVKLIDDTDNKTLYLVIKKDINADTYYKEHLLASDILYLIKGDEFTEMVEEYMKTLDYSVSKFAINQFKVKNISYGA